MRAQIFFCLLLVATMALTLAVGQRHHRTWHQRVTRRPYQSIKDDGPIHKEPEPAPKFGKHVFTWDSMENWAQKQQAGFTFKPNIPIVDSNSQCTQTDPNTAYAPSDAKFHKKTGSWEDMEEWSSNKMKTFNQESNERPNPKDKQPEPSVSSMFTSSELDSLLEEYGMF